MLGHNAGMEETMSAIPFVGKIQNLYQFDPDMLEGIWGCQSVSVTEKLHGTSALLAIFPDRVEVGGHRRMYGPGEGIKDQYEITMAIGQRVREQMLAEGGVPSDRVIIYGEFAGQGIQKGIKYTEKGRGFWAFDVLIGESMHLDTPESAEFCARYGIEFVPVLYVGKPNQEVFNNLYVQDSHVLDIPGNMMEGIVISSVPPMFDRRGSPIRAKHKNEKWSEKASAPKEPRKRDDDEYIAFAQMYVNKVRILHAVERLRVEGNWQRAMNDMQRLPGLIMEDLKEEVGLGNLDERKARRAITQLTARLYKQMLLNAKVL